MKVSARCDTAKGFAALDAARDAIKDRAIPRALNTLADQAQTAGFRTIADVYQIPARTMQQYASRTDARAGDFLASINVKGKGFPLVTFKPIQTAQGVTVLVKGRRILIAHAFLARMPGGHFGVFARGQYGGKFNYGAGKRRITKPRKERTELPIAELFTFGPVDAFNNKQVTAAMNDRVDQQSAAVLRREIAAVVRGF